MTGRKIEEAERRRLVGDALEGLEKIYVGCTTGPAVSVNITPWPDTADNPECEDKPAEQSKSGIMRLPSDSPWLRDLAASIDARPAEPEYDVEQREISYNHTSVDAPEPTMPDLRALYDPRPTPEPDTYGTDAARLEDSLRYWAELDLAPAPPCGHDRGHVVRGYCVACAWEANGTCWGLDDNTEASELCAAPPGIATRCRCHRRE